MPARTIQHIFFQLTLLAVQAGCLLLLVLARFGQNPPEALPLPTIVFFGAMLSGILHPLSRDFRVRELGVAVVLAGLLGAGLNLLLQVSPDHTAAWLLAPATALAITLALRLVGQERGDMLSAMTVYTTCTVLANYTLDSFLPIGDFFLVNVGTFFFGVTFTQRDRVHRYGRRNVYLMIAVAAVANVIMSVAIDTPMRYVVVAFIAILIAETADTEIYQRLLHRPWLVRVARSNAISAPLDTIIFTVLAFFGEDFATFGWMNQVIITDILVKFLASMLVAFGVVTWLRRAAFLQVSGQALPDARHGADRL